ncbi:hypothetical protein NE237_013991 [Protea cynaroides]|uniref:Aluminum-activated malate transporter n=1 Tax=Protea cynaroides TaxID=273540 RepID=A0A9Q0H0C3_9MAGN|nr:hypothetical protein NE237_013991 [Protea cynaroides]
MQRPNTSVVSSPSRQRTPIKRHEQKTLANRSKSGGGGSKTIGKSIAGSMEVHNLSNSSKAESLNNDDVDWQQHGEGSDNQNHSESEGCQSDREDDEVSDGGQSGGCMSGNEDDEDQAILKYVDTVTSTFSRFFPRIKQRYDYGAMIFILTFSLVSVSGYREDKIIEIAYERLTTIITAGVACVILSIFICPVWAGEDLHNMVAQNLEMIASFLEGFGGEYFRSPEDGDSHVISEGKKPFPMEYRSVLNSKATKQSLVSIEPLPLTEICVL